MTRPAPPTRRLLPGLWLPLLTLAAACDATARAATTVVVTGSSTIAPLMVEIGRRFERDHPGVRVDVQTGGSGRGLADARTGRADIGMVSRRLGPDEADLIGTTLALDGIGLLVHADNTLASLTREQTVAIFTGELRDWSELGRAAGPITVVSKAEGRSTLEVFLGHFGLQSDQLEPSVLVGDNEQGVKTVAGNPDAIGYVSIGAAEVSIASGVPVRLVALDGVEASTESIAAGRFPLCRPLNLVTRGAPDELAAELLDFASSPAVRDLVLAQPLTPVSSE